MNDHLDTSVKKRSLSNYLSNVNSRREELESLKKKQEEERQKLALLQREHQDEQKIEKDTHVEEQGERQDPVIDEDQPSEPASFEQERVEQSSIALQPAAQKDASHNLKSLDLNVEDGGRGIPSDKAGVALKVQEEHISAKAQSGISMGEELETGEHKNEKIFREDLHAMLKEPEVRHESPGAEDNSEDEETMEKNAKKEEDSDEDVASDAPTEPASPPRPRRRRLIRGDRLSSLSPRHSTFDNESDSELSDIDELKSIQISSSFIHGDSSPTRDVEESKRRLHRASSPRLVRRSMSPRHAKHHVTVPRASKQKKGVYRDAGGRTRLQISCDKGNYEQAKKLIEEGDYDVNDQDNAGNTALHEAALNGHLDVVKLLIENDADVNTQSFEMFRDTPLIDASANGHLEVVKYLLSHGADPTICNAKGLTAFESIEDIDLDEQEKEIADEIKRSLRSAARNWKDKKSVDDTRLKKRQHFDQPQAKQRSEEPLGDFDFFWTDISSRAGRDKLFRASKEGKLSYVGAYLENGGKVDLKSFFEAVKFGHEDIASLFLAFGAHVNAVSKNGTTALICAVGRGHLGTVKLLLEAGADPSKTDKHGNGALHYAENSPMGVVNLEEIKLLEHALADASPDEKPQRKVDQTTAGLPDIADEEQEIFKKQKVLTELHEGHEDEENVVSIARKRRTMSPDRLEKKRQALADETLFSKSPTPEDPDAGNLSASKANEAARSEYENVKVHEETPEEKEQRLKAEEEYIQKRLQNKRRKEQELLRKLALDEEKREKEKALQKVEEAEKLRERERLRQIEQNNKNREVEIARRREIRSLYPLGLRLVDFNDTDDYISYLPLYFIEAGVENTKYVLDLQVCVITKDANFSTNVQDIHGGIPVQMKHKRQLWNIMKLIFLYGGNKYAFDWGATSLPKRTQFELQEYAKFSNLPMQWVKLQDISISDKAKKEHIEQTMVQIVLEENSKDVPTLATPRESSQKPQFLVKTAPMPTKFQKRRTILHEIENYGAQPLW